MEEHVLRKVTWRLIPFLFLLYICAYLDRVNVGFAALQMKTDLKFTDSITGFGGGIFFIGYFFFEVPSNLVMMRVGARIWIARIMLTWGIISCATMVTHSALQFYILRCALGAAEAGFFPGMIFYLTYWFPAAARARAVARFMTATAIANVVGSPISGQLLKLEGVGGLHGWQWLFILEGIPSIILGFVVFFYLPDRPSTARWLKPQESAWLEERLRDEESRKLERHGIGLMQAFGNIRVLHLCALYFSIVVGGYALTLWMPTMIKNLGSTDTLKIGLLTAIPYTCAAIAMVIVGTHSDRTRERRLHVAVPAFVAMVGLLMVAFFKQPQFATLAFIGLCLAALGQASTLGPFWALPTSFLSGAAAAGGIAFINSVGNLGGFVGPYAMGWLKQRTGDFVVCLYILAGFLALAGILGLLAPHDQAVESLGDEPLELEIAETETAF